MTLSRQDGFACHLGVAEGFAACALSLLTGDFLHSSFGVVDHFWRLPLWIHFLAVLVISFATLTLTLGWARTRTIFPAFLFAFVLVPLPSALEGLLVGNLTRAVSMPVGELLPLAGYPIDRVGNAMMVKGKILGRCRGLQRIAFFSSSFMTGLFLGECYQLVWLRRLLLLGLAIVFAMLGNGARIFYLSTVAYREGMAAEERVHGSAGLISLILIYGLIGLSGWLLSRAPQTVTRISVRGEVAS